jgi:hypothetical protein
MSTREIAERTESLAKNLNINQEEALKLVQQEEAEKQLRTKVLKHLKSVWDIGLAGLPQILTLLSSPVPLVLGATASGFVTSVWGREQQNKLIDELKKQINERINETNAKLNEPALSFDEFMELFVQAMDIASKSKSELKRQALAKALVNSLIPPTSDFTGKQALLRILSQLSDEEMVALKVLYDGAIEAQNQGDLPHVPVTKVAEKLGWEEEEAYVTCEALAQLLLLSDASQGQWNSFGHEHEVWRITALATTLIQWVTEEIPPATATEANTSEPMDSAEKAAWSQLTAEQFFSGYSEADAIYDTI